MYSIAEAVRSFQKKMHLTTGYVLTHNSVHLREELNELDAALTALKVKAEKAGISFDIWQPNFDEAETASLLPELTAVCDALGDMSFLIQGIWNVLNIHSDEQFAILDAISLANLNKIYFPGVAKKCTKPPCWEGPEKTIDRIIRGRARRNAAGSANPTVWTLEDVERAQKKISLFKAKAGATQCERAQYVGAMIEYSHNGSVAGRIESYGVSTPGPGCTKSADGTCPKKCEAKIQPGMQVLKELAAKFRPPLDGEKTYCSMIMHGYKEQPPKLVEAFRQVAKAIGADSNSVLLYRSPPKLDAGIVEAEAQAKWISDTLRDIKIAQPSISKESLSAIEKILQGSKNDGSNELF